MNKILLGVNIDHIATIRNSRKTQYPDPIYAAFIAEQAGADGITIHLREDYRHITKRDVKLLRQTLQTKMNLEMAITNEMIDFACNIKPEFCCLVPEKRSELTTEDGLDVVKQQDLITKTIKILTEAGIKVSLFINPEIIQIDAALETKTSFIELHTGKYANAKNKVEQILEFKQIQKAVKYAKMKKLNINAGHGLTYDNVYCIAQLPEIYELNIGHSIIGRAVFCGLASAIIDMKSIINEARN